MSQDTPKRLKVSNNTKELIGTDEKNQNHPKSLDNSTQNDSGIANSPDSQITEPGSKIQLSSNIQDSTSNRNFSSRRQKQSQPIPEPSTDNLHCHYWVKRKSRYCKMTIKAGAKFCGEHSIEDTQPVLDERRIPCPLDPSHSIFSNKLNKHLKICNANKLTSQAAYVKKGINIGDPESAVDNEFKLREVPQDEIDKITQKVVELFEKFVNGSIKSRVMKHKVLEEEITKDCYGDEKLRHLVQTSSILGILNDNNLLTTQTCFIDLGAGKGKLSYWLSKAILDDDIKDSKVLVVDRASHRHKRDNLVKESGVVERLRVDIGDLDMTELDLSPCKAAVGVSKHLCGRATDFALRCLINGNKGSVKSKGFLICVCCHHQITFDSFLGRDWMVENGFDRRSFNVLTKMVSWCICGDGRSREERKESGLVQDEKVKERELVGWKCKRLLDYARVDYMRTAGFETELCYYVEKDQTLENVCIFGKMTEK